MGLSTSAMQLLRGELNKLLFFMWPHFFWKPYLRMRRAACLGVQFESINYFCFPKGNLGLLACFYLPSRTPTVHYWRQTQRSHECFTSWIHHATPSPVFLQLSNHTGIGIVGATDKRKHGRDSWVLKRTWAGIPWWIKESRLWNIRKFSNFIKNI